MKIGIGIDTGGTYTDAVVYDFANRTILADAKSLTTRRDLAVGILGALDQLPADLVREADLISLSTTLATNACVEDRLGRAKLIFLGGNPKTIGRYGPDFGLPPVGEIHLQDSHTTFSGKIEREMDWEEFRRAAREFCRGLDGIGLIEMNAMRNGAVVEKRAKEILGEITGAPVVCGHELSSELSCLQRGAGTLLNAGLFPVIGGFLEAVRRALVERGVRAPVVIVRSDGSMMSGDFAALRPVETLLCGPAASVLGGGELARRSDCVVIDMGGTTTDIAVVRGGVPLGAAGGIAIGKWRTFVKGVYIHTFGLGGDSAVHYRDNNLFLEDYRVVPLCALASAHPEIADRFRDDEDFQGRHTRFLHEFFALNRDISASPHYSAFEKRFCDVLADGPLPRRRAALAVGRDEYTLDVDRLVREGVVQVAGLTPTDIMHLRGDFVVHDPAAARLAAEFVAMNVGLDVDALCAEVYRLVRRKMYFNVIEALLRTQEKEYAAGVGEETARMILRSFDRHLSGAPGVRLRFSTELPLVGIGAPTHLFLSEVAEMLGTKAVNPPHAGVANAVGAIVGQVHARKEVLIRPSYNTSGVTGYEVYADDGREFYEEWDEAESRARSLAEGGARDEAARRGAQGDITVASEVDSRSAAAYDGEIYLGSTVIADAVGAPAFESQCAMSGS